MKRTATQRIERAVNRQFDRSNSGYLAPSQIATLILAERARLKRGVKKVQRTGDAMGKESDWWDGYSSAANDILTLWEG